MVEQIKQGTFGGFVASGHPATFWPKTWAKVHDDYNIKTVVDIGCGSGVSTTFWKDTLNCDVLGIDGFVSNTSLRLFPFIANDYNKASALTDQQFDLCICSEFAEHVLAENQYLFLKDFTHAKYLMFNAATPNQAVEDIANGFEAHNHVNERSVPYWIKHIERFGFTYDHDYSMELRKTSYQDALVRPDDPFNHFMHKGLFFTRTNAERVQLAAGTNQ